MSDYDIKQIGNYVIEGLLGKGAMGEVLKGVHPQIGKQVAIKILVKHLSDMENMNQRFIQEALAINRIEHPNIIEIYDFGKLDDGRYYYTMEFLKGLTLSKLMRKRPLNIKEITRIFREISDALDAVHKRGIIHRDLKPGNIFIAKKGRKNIVKILDFGIAKFIGPDEASMLSTSTGTVLGTPVYMSPEQAMGNGAISNKADIYSVGVILFKMLSGHLPLKGHSLGEIIAAHIQGRKRTLKEVNPDIPDKLCNVVEKAIEYDVESRYGDIYKLYQDFKEAVKDLDPNTVFDKRKRKPRAHKDHAVFQSSSGINEKYVYLEKSGDQIVPLNEKMSSDNPDDNELPVPPPPPPPPVSDSVSLSPVSISAELPSAENARETPVSHNSESVSMGTPLFSGTDPSLSVHSILDSQSFNSEIIQEQSIGEFSLGEISQNSFLKKNSYVYFIVAFVLLVTGGYFLFGLFGGDGSSSEPSEVASEKVVAESENKANLNDKAQKSVKSSGKITKLSGTGKTAKTDLNASSNKSPSTENKLISIDLKTGQTGLNAIISYEDKNLNVKLPYVLKTRINTKIALRISKPGFKSKTFDLVADKNQKINITLIPEKTKSSPVGTMRKSSRRRVRRKKKKKRLLGDDLL